MRGEEGYTSLYYGNGARTVANPTSFKQLARRPKRTNRNDVAPIMANKTAKGELHITADGEGKLLSVRNPPPPSHDCQQRLPTARPGQHSGHQVMYEPYEPAVRSSQKESSEVRRCGYTDFSASMVSYQAGAGAGPIGSVLEYSKRRAMPRIGDVPSTRGVERIPTLTKAD